MIRHIETHRPGSGTETLPLFEELAADQAISERRDATRSRPRVDRHLAAARRLAKAMRRLPDHSAEQTQAGQAICRHLIALLAENVEENDQPNSPRR